jgi:chloramphenicol 3-O phosphotransferase
MRRQWRWAPNLTRAVAAYGTLRDDVHDGLLERVACPRMSGYGLRVIEVRAAKDRGVTEDVPGDSDGGLERAPIIFLNGASSSGKTSIAHALQETLDHPSIHLSEDAFFDMAMGARLGGSAQERVYGILVLLGMYRSIGTFAALGLTVIVDVVLEERAWLHECLWRLEGFDVLFVGVCCPLEELDRRERARPDRRHVGLARSHFELVHAHGIYDLEVDTASTTPLGAAQQIKYALEHTRPFTAFPRLRALGY